MISKSDATPGLFLQTFPFCSEASELDAYEAQKEADGMKEQSGSYWICAVILDFC
jgi:hypothetical protein